MRGCRSLGAEDHRMDLVAWLRELGSKDTRLHFATTITSTATYCGG